MSGILPQVSRLRDSRGSWKSFGIISWVVRHNGYLRAYACAPGVLSLSSQSLCLLKGVSNGSDKSFVIQGLDEKTSSTGPHHGGFGSAILMNRDENHTSFGRSSTQVCQDFHSRHPFHPDIQDNKPYAICRHFIEKILWIAKGTYVESLQFKQATDGFAHRWIVVNEIAYLLGASRRRVRRRLCFSCLGHGCEERCR